MELVLAYLAVAATLAVGISAGGIIYATVVTSKWYTRRVAKAGQAIAKETMSLFTTNSDKEET